MAAQTDAEILGRLVNSKNGRLTRAAAEELLSLRFSDFDLGRMNELSAKAQRGMLTGEQREEAERYDRIGHFVALLHSKARLSLKAESDEAGGR